MTWVKLLALLFAFWPVLLLLLAFNSKMGWKAAFIFAGVQLVSWWAQVLGWFILIRPCLKQAWVVDADSIANELEPRPGKISRWATEWLNVPYGNPHEGVNGKEALIRDSTGKQVPYMPDADPRWRAYCWSAWRNSVDGLKYLFEWPGGPLVVLTVFGRQVRAGWLPMPQIKGVPRVPVLG